MFRSGNPAPCGDADAILAQGKKFYEELSPETGVFFNTMLDNELLDVLSTPGKAAGGTLPRPKASSTSPLTFRSTRKSISSESEPLANLIKCTSSTSSGGRMDCLPSVLRRKTTRSGST